MKKVLLTVGVITALTLGTSVFASADQATQTKNGNLNSKSTIGKQKNGGEVSSLNKKNPDKTKGNKLSSKTLEDIKEQIKNRKYAKIDSRVAEGDISKEKADQKKEKIKEEIDKASSIENLKNALKNNKDKKIHNKSKIKQ